MPDTNDFYYVGKSERQPAELFINLKNVSRTEWDGESMNIYFNDAADNAFVYGEAGKRLRSELAKRCVNDVPLSIEG